MKGTSIKTSKPTVILKELAIEDAAAYFALVKKNCAHMNKFGTMSETRYKSEEDVIESITNPPNPKKLRFGVWDKNKLVGMVTLTNKGNKRCEIGGWIGNEFIRKGYATASLQSLIKYAQKSLRYKRIIATTYPDNIPSQKMLIKIGFTRTRKLQKRHYFAFQK